MTVTPVRSRQSRGGLFAGGNRRQNAFPNPIGDVFGWVTPRQMKSFGILGGFSPDA